MVLLVALVLLIIWQAKRDGRRWETYCYPEAPRAQVVDLVIVRIIQNIDGQPGWWVLAGDRSDGCLLMHYDRNRDGRRDLLPLAEYVGPYRNRCCRNGGM